MYASVSCSFPMFPVCIILYIIIFATAKLRIYFFSPPRKRTFLCRCPSFRISWVAILLCNFAVCVLFLLKYFFPVFPFYNVSFSFPISDEGTSCVVYLLVDRFVSNWFWNRWSPSLCGNLLARGPESSPRKRMGFVFSFCIAFSFLFFFFHLTVSHVPIICRGFFPSISLCQTFFLAFFFRVSLSSHCVYIDLFTRSRGQLNVCFSLSHCYCCKRMLLFGWSGCSLWSAKSARSERCAHHAACLSLTLSKMWCCYAEQNNVQTFIALCEKNTNKNGSTPQRKEKKPWKENLGSS